MASHRLAREDDVETLLPLMRGLYEHDGDEFNAVTHRAALMGLLAHPERGQVWLVEDDGAAVGYAVLTFGYSLEYRGRDALVDELFLAESHRGRGLGMQTLAFLEAECRRQGIAALHLEVARGNTRAQAVYRAAGFFSHDRILMTKWVGGA